MHHALARLRSTVAALLVAVLVIVPVVDAFACSFESDGEHAAAVGDDHAASATHDDAGKGGVPDGTHGVCAHNHCHHSSANLFFSATVGYDTTRSLQAAFLDPLHALGVYEGLMRPPRS